MIASFDTRGHAIRFVVVLLIMQATLQGQGVEELQKRWGPMARRLLLDGLRSRDDWVRWAALNALSDLGDPDQSLKREVAVQLTAKHWEVRFAAAHALQRMGDPLGTSFLKAALDEKAKQGLAGRARAIGLAGDTGGFDRLMQLVKEGDPPSRVAACLAMGSIFPKLSGDEKSQACTALSAATRAVNRPVRVAAAVGLCRAEFCRQRAWLTRAALNTGAGGPWPPSGEAWAVLSEAIREKREKTDHIVAEGLLQAALTMAETSADEPADNYVRAIQPPMAGIQLVVMKNIVNNGFPIPTCEAVRGLGLLGIRSVIPFLGKHIHTKKHPRISVACAGAILKLLRDGRRVHMYEELDDDAIVSWEYARDAYFNERSRRRLDYMGCEVLLLGLIENHTTAVRVLEQLGVDLTQLNAAALHEFHSVRYCEDPFYVEYVKEFEQKLGHRPPLGLFTVELNRTISIARKEAAKRRGRPVADPLSLLLAMVEQRGPGGRHFLRDWLLAKGISPADVRRVASDESAAQPHTEHDN